MILTKNIIKVSLENLENEYNTCRKEIDIIKELKVLLLKYEMTNNYKIIDLAISKLLVLYLIQN